MDPEDHYGDWTSGDSFAQCLDETKRLLMVVLDSLGLEQSCVALSTEWSTFKARDGGLKDWNLLPDYEVVLSEPFDYLEDTIIGLRALAGSYENSLIAFQLEQLDNLLGKTSVLVHSSGSPPQTEHDIQTVMNDYLTAWYDDYLPKPEIPGEIKNFIPDGGIPSIGAAIEFKFVTSTDELKVALSGLHEDRSAYSGSSVYNHFFCVVYMTEPFVSEKRFGFALHKGSGVTFNEILVVGPGQRKVRKKHTRKTNTPRKKTTKKNNA